MPTTFTDLRDALSEYARLSFPDSREIDQMSQRERETRERDARAVAVRVADMCIDLGVADPCGEDCEPFAHYGCAVAADMARTEAAAREVVQNGAKSAPAAPFARH